MDGVNASAACARKGNGLQIEPEGVSLRFIRAYDAVNGYPGVHPVFASVYLGHLHCRVIS